MSDVNGWKIVTEKPDGVALHLITHDTKIAGRAVKFGSQWEAMDGQGIKPIYHDKGVEVTSKRLCDLPVALADAEISIDTERLNRAKQDSRKRSARHKPKRALWTLQETQWKIFPISCWSNSKGKSDQHTVKALSQKRTERAKATT